MFAIEAIGIPQKYVNTLNMLIKDFVWNNKEINNPVRTQVWWFKRAEH